MFQLHFAYHKGLQKTRSIYIAKIDNKNRWNGKQKCLLMNGVPCNRVQKIFEVVAENCITEKLIYLQKKSSLKDSLVGKYEKLCIRNKWSSITVYSLYNFCCKLYNSNKIKT